MGKRRAIVFAWIAGVVGLAAVVFAVVASIVDLGFAESAAEPASLIVAGIGLILAAVGLVVVRRDSRSSKVVRATGRNAVAAGGNVAGNAFGHQAKARTSKQPPGTPRNAAEDLSVSAAGEGSVSAGRDVDGNAFGNESRA